MFIADEQEIDLTFHHFSISIESGLIKGAGTEVQTGSDFELEGIVGLKGQVVFTKLNSDAAAKVYCRGLYFAGTQEITGEHGPDLSEPQDCFRIWQVTLPTEDRQSLFID